MTKPENKNKHHSKVNSQRSLDLRERSRAYIRGVEDAKEGLPGACPPPDIAADKDKALDWLEGWTDQTEAMRD